VTDPQLHTTSDEAECFPSGWAALNPVEWVLKPVKCALVWAFVPPPTFTDGLVNSAGGAWSSSGPGRFWDGIFPVWTAIAGVNTAGCAGPTANFHIVSFNVSFAPFNACDGVGRQVAAIVKVCLTVSVFMGALIVMLKNVASALGWQVHLADTVKNA
jgi:hypothetical protein